ncbi:hypothetical protein BCR34DRAFT_564610 [Clohesyomyces aquaticus]|uniref:C2H2-type domain-containing protein n=1 Tax=Clohesyomyces aquaticus TaxID=1231657 RepID=A0A1Y1ZNX0_9PLEO|nr:hypothetical protein BCR34DRAFT_564610 [Clohesyomyces aquaticus]
MTKNWDEVHEVIRRLYVSERRPLSEVMKILQTDPRYKFSAHERSFRIKLREWQFTRERRISVRRSPNAVIPPPASWDRNLRHAIERNQSYELNTLVEQISNLPHLDNGMPLIHYAALCGSSERVFRVLINHGADIDILHNHEGINSSIMQVLLRNHSRISRSSRSHSEIYKTLRYLFSQGVDLHPLGTGERTPFDIFIDPWRTDPEWYLTATEYERSCLRSFLSNGAVIETPFHSRRCPQSNSQTFLHIALFHTDLPTARFIIENTKSLPGSNGETLLPEFLKGCQDTCSLSSGLFPDLLQALLDGGADPNALNVLGQPPLFTLLSRDLPTVPTALLDCVTCLINRGADPFLPCEDGRTTIEYLLRNLDVFDNVGLELAEVFITGTSDTRFSWASAYFPITNEFERYSKSTPFWTAVVQHLPERYAEDFAKTALSVSTWMYLDNFLPVANTTDAILEIIEVLWLRERHGFPGYNVPEGVLLRLLSNLVTQRQPEPPSDLRFGMMSGYLLQNPLRPPPAKFSGGVFQDSDMTYMCPICPTIPGVYLENWQLKDHYEQHAHAFVCGERHCEQRFKSRTALDDHEKAQHWYLCDFIFGDLTMCGIRFKSAVDFEQHKKDQGHRIEWEM